MDSTFIHSFFFFFFSALAIISAVSVIFVNNPIYAILYLISVFFNSALLLLLLDLEFFAVTFIIIYIGALMVLFLFVIMMLDIRQTSLYIDIKYYFCISGLIIIALFFSIIYLINEDFILDLPEGLKDNYINWFNSCVEYSSISVLGSYLYTFFAFYFLMAGLILLVAMVGAIILTLSPIPTNKRQFLYNQVYRSPKDAVFLVK